MRGGSLLKEGRCDRSGGGDGGGDVREGGV